MKAGVSITSNAGDCTGVRWGGKEPVLLPELAMELSGWYEGQFRTETGPYGLPLAQDPNARDRRVKQMSHLFWARALLAYTLPEWKHNFNISLTIGARVSHSRLRLATRPPSAPERVSGEAELLIERRGMGFAHKIRRIVGRACRFRCEWIGVG